MGRKSKRSELMIYLNQQLCGTLRRSASNILDFRYSSAYLDHPQARAISLSMPLRAGGFSAKVVHSYFDNLIPDSQQIRQRLATNVNASSTESFDILERVGRDCVGALQLIPAGEPAPGKARIKAKLISASNLRKLVDGLAISPLGLTKQGKEFRISLAGMQLKTALLFYRKRWMLPLGATPTSHILKPAIGKLANGIDMSDSVENEWLCARIARFFGLSVAESHVRQIAGRNVLFVERFDRKWNGAILQRIPQEDLCQALGVPSHLKYQSDGGPGIRQIMQLLDSSDQREADRASFMRAQLVFYLIGAIDGHAKNFSIFLNRYGFKLSPLYDILSAALPVKRKQIQSKELKLAMSIGDANYYRYRQIQSRHWFQTAKKCGLSSNNLSSIIEDLLQRSKTLDEHISQVLTKKSAPRVSNELIEAILQFIEKHKALF